MKIILNALGIQVENNLDPEFDDVTENDWFFDYVMTAYQKGIVSGYDAGDFKPNDEVNLAETLKILLLAADVDLEDEVSFDVFNDVDKDSWFAASMLYARDMNLILSDEEGKVYPDKSMTRAGFAEIIYRMIMVLDTGNPFSLHENWSYYESDKLPFKMKYDDSWEIIEREDEITFWYDDSEYNQFSPSRIYPNSAEVKVVYDIENNANKNDYFNNLKEAFSDADLTEFILDDNDAIEVLFPEDRIVDWYIYLGDSSVLAIYTEYGNGDLAYQNKQIIQSMLSTLEYMDVDIETEDYSDLISEILENILVENTGEDTLDLLPDSTIIETDTIGVGTGPVDYYYSETIDYTFKYERESDVILDYRESQTTAF